ncbi:MAG: ATP-binding protein, partial [Bradyrhizobium sp.]
PAASSDEDDEGAPAIAAKPAAPTVVAAAAKPADPVPTPRAKPQIAAALQLASADAQIVAPVRPKPAPEADKPAASAKPETPADIINARGFWDAIPATPQQATPAQVAALKARQALAAATDQQPAASISSAAYQALAYAPAAASPVDRANVVAASAPIPRAARPAPATRSLAQATEINTVVGKSTNGLVATATRLSAAKGESIWLKIVMLSPSASRAMSVTLMGELDMAAMRAYFVKPQAVIAMSFTDDPTQGLSCDSFSGAAAAKLETTSFVMRTASLR